MSIFKSLMNFKQLSFLFLLRSHVLIFIFILSILNVSQVTFSQENKFTEANGWSRHPNGGGLVHRDARVSPSAYIGSDARVYGGTIEGDVRVSGGIIESGRLAGNAEVSGGIIKDGYIHGDAKISGGTISGDTTDIFGGTISGNAEVSGGVVYGRADIRGGTISGNARISGGTIYEGAEVSGGRVSGRAEVRGKVTGGRVDGNAIIPRGAVVREGMHINDHRLLSRFDKVKRKALKNLPYVGRVIAVGASLYQMLKTDLSASELESLTGDLIGDALYSKDLDSSDLPLEDYLQNLKIASQHLDPSKTFSQERQHLSNELHAIYTDIQTDESLSDEEKKQYLKTVAEIQDIAQPPTPPRRPPSQRSRRKTSKGIN